MIWQHIFRRGLLFVRQHIICIIKNNLTDAIRKPSTNLSLNFFRSFAIMIPHALPSYVSIYGIIPGSPSLIHWEKLKHSILLNFPDVMKSCCFQVGFNSLNTKMLQWARSAEYGGWRFWGTWSKFAARDMINAGNSVVCWADKDLLSNTAINKGNEQERYNLVCIFATEVKVNPSQAASLYIQ